MTDYLDEWLNRKRERSKLTIREQRTSHYKHSRSLGPRGEFAVVHLRAAPAECFSFKPCAAWPDSRSNYSPAVLDGILDELFANGLGRIVANIEFTLEAIEWHEVDSSATAFYHASRGAVREILGLEKTEYNIQL